MSTFSVGLFVFVVIVGLRVGLRFLVRTGMNAALGDAGPIKPSCPYCSSTSTVQAGGTWDCRACGRTF